MKHSLKRSGMLPAPPKQPFSKLLKAFSSDPDLCEPSLNSPKHCQMLEKNMFFADSSEINYRTHKSLMFMP